MITTSNGSAPGIVVEPGCPDCTLTVALMGQLVVVDGEATFDLGLVRYRVTAEGRLLATVGEPVEVDAVLGDEPPTPVADPAPKAKRTSGPATEPATDA